MPSDNCVSSETLDAKLENIVDKIAVLSVLVHESKDEREKQFNEIRATTTDISSRIDLCLNNPERGLHVRVDRLEQSDKRRSFWINSAIGASVSSIVAHLASFFKN